MNGAENMKPAWNVVLKELRALANCTQKEWLDKLNDTAVELEMPRSLARSTLQKWEKGQSVPRPSSARVIIQLAENEGLFRTCEEGKLKGLTIDADFLANLLKEAREARRSVSAASTEDAGPFEEVSIDRAQLNPLPEEGQETFGAGAPAPEEGPPLAVDGWRRRLVVGGTVAGGLLVVLLATIGGIAALRAIGGGEENTPTPTPAMEASGTLTKPAEVVARATRTSAPTSTPGPVARAACPFGSSLWPDPVPPPGLEATIKKPAHCAADLAAGELFQAGGTYSGDLSGKELWVVVFAPNGFFYPQGRIDRNCEPSPAEASGGRWNTLVQLSEKNHPAEAFDVRLTLVDAGSEASRVIREYLRTGCAQRSHPGLVELPEGTTDLAAAYVQTRSGQ